MPSSDTSAPDLLHLVSADGTRLGAQRQGQGPALLLVHGTYAQRQHWRLVVDALAREYTVYALDRRGRGASGDAPGYAIEREFEDVAAWIAHLGRDTPVIAHSYGAICTLGGARLAAHEGPLVLYEPPIGYMADAEAIARIAAASGAGQQEDALGIFLTEVLGLPAIALEVTRHWPDWEGRLRMVPTIARELRAIHDLGAAPEHLLQGRQAPVDVLVGGDSDEGFHRAARFLTERLPQVRLHILPGQQHQAVELAPRQFEALALSLLREHARASARS